MTETKSTSPLSAQEQARIRRERRQAKVSQTGTSRLNRITFTQGSGFRSEEPALFPASVTSINPQTPSPSTINSTPDPPDIDIAAADHSHIYPSLPMRTVSKDDELRQSMMMDSLFQQPFPGAGSSPEAHGADDPFMHLLQQMGGMGKISGIAGADVNIDNIGGMDGLARLAGMAGMTGIGGDGSSLPTIAGVGQQQTMATSRSAIFWKTLHGLLAIALGIWAMSMGNAKFKGSEKQRTESLYIARNEKPQVFWYFATMELLLQSTRFMVEKGRPPQVSMLTTIGNFLPPPFCIYVTTLARYSIFISTIMADAGMVIFVFGVTVMLNSEKRF